MESWLMLVSSQDREGRPDFAIVGDQSFHFKHQIGTAWLSAARDTHVVVANVGSRCLAVIGETTVNAGHLVGLLLRHGTPHDAMDAAHRSPGSYHIIYGDPRGVVVQGSASGLRQVCYMSDDNEQHWISDSPGCLAHIGDCQPRIEVVASGLIYPGLDYGIGGDPYWAGVTRLQADQRLHVYDKSVFVKPWWTPTRDELTIDEGKDALKETLDRAVEVRSRSGLPITADLSGGMDSTSLCAILAEQDIRFRSIVEETIDPNHEDSKWATEAAQAIGCELRVLTPGELPAPYDDIAGSDGSVVDLATYETDAPYTLIRNRARKKAISTLLAGAGPVTHVAGFGGDEIFTVAPSYFSDAYRRNAIGALIDIRPLAHLRRWSLSAVLRALRVQDTYHEWFRKEIASLQDPFDPHAPTLTWGPQLRLPRWMSRGGGEIVREHLNMYARDAIPQAPDRATHTALAGQRIGGMRLAPLRRLMAAHGVSLSLPYMDDHVLEVSLRISQRESLPGKSYKPFLKAAMRESSVRAVLQRSTKGEFSMSVHRGLSKNSESLIRLLEDSLLVEHDLVDPQRLKSAIRDNMRPQRDTAALELTIAAEVWLRRIRSQVTPASKGPIIQWSTDSAIRAGQ